MLYQNSTRKARGKDCNDSMDISATTIALQRSGLVEPIHRETRQFAKPIWEKKHKNKRNRLSRAASSDPTPKNKIETLTGSHHPIAMITSSTETRRRMLLPHQNHSKCGTENRQDCALVTPKKKAGTNSASKSSCTLLQATPISHQHVPK
jgi:hypothetical protein